MKERQGIPITDGGTQRYLKRLIPLGEQPPGMFQRTLPRKRFPQNQIPRARKCTFLSFGLHLLPLAVSRYPWLSALSSSEENRVPALHELALVVLVHSSCSTGQFFSNLLCFCGRHIHCALWISVYRPSDARSERLRECPTLL